MQIEFDIDSALDLLQPRDVQLAPGGGQLAFVLASSNKVDAHTPHEKSIHLIDVDSGVQRRLTGSGTLTNESPRWSPDGKRIAFISNRANGEEKQLYILDLDGGEAQALTDLRGSVSDPMWLPDSEVIAFLYDGTLDAEKAPDPDPVVVDAQPTFSRVWMVDVATRQLHAITPAEVHIHEYALARDGRTLALVVSSHPNPMEGWYNAQLYTMPVDGGALKHVCPIDHQFGRLSWSPDGTAIAFVSGVMSDEGNIAGDVFVVPAAGGEARNVTPGIDQSITWIDWRVEGILYCARRIEGVVIGWVDPQNGETRTIVEGEYSLIGVSYTEALSVAGDGFAAVRESHTESPNIHLGSFAANDWQRRIADFPLDTAHFPPLNVENKYWQGRDGMPVHGWVVYPSGYVPGKPYPMVANVHGGPSLSITPRYVNTWVRLFTSLGCAVFLPNPRGSWGRGHAYQAANVGDLGGGDWQDIDAGIDLMVQEGIADPEHLAIAGWSYGGYLVTWAVTQTDRFRCAIAGASITNYESNYGVVLNREWQTTMFGSNVYEDFELHRSRSPIAFVSRVKTPTLLVHGMEDVVAPPQQAMEFYVALRHFGVPAELVLYPREPHGFQERAHQRDLFGRMERWLKTYLF